MVKPRVLGWLGSEAGRALRIKMIAKCGMIALWGAHSAHKVLGRLPHEAQGGGVQQVGQWSVHDWPWLRGCNRSLV
jgi:hypothetical protein